MKKKNLNWLLIALAAMALVFAGACSDGSDDGGSDDVNGTYSGTSITVSGGSAGNAAIAAAIQKFAGEEDGTFTASSLSIELDNGSYTVVMQGYWAQVWSSTYNVNVYFTYTMTGTYTESGSTITLNEPTVSIVYHGYRVDGGSMETSVANANYETTDEAKDSVSAIKTIFENITLTYSSGSLVIDIDYDALDKALAEENEE